MDSGKTKKTKKTWGTVALALGLTAVAALVIFGVTQLFVPRETISTPTSTSSSINALVCEAEDPQEKFFATDGAVSVDHVIKATYVDSVADKISYTYEADYGSPEAATKAEAQLHADYNIFMGKNGDDFTAQFMPMGDELKISVFAETKNLGSLTSRVFFINTEEFEELKDYDVQDLAKIFQRKGFSCEFDEN